MPSPPAGEPFVPRTLSFFLQAGGAAVAAEVPADRAAASRGRGPPGLCGPGTWKEEEVRAVNEGVAPHLLLVVPVV